MQRFKEGDLVRRRVFDDYTGDWVLVENEMWVFLKGYEDHCDRSYGVFLSPLGEIVKTPQAYFIDEIEADSLRRVGLCRENTA
jgi:hypothetical protein